MRVEIKKEFDKCSFCMATTEKKSKSKKTSINSEMQEHLFDNHPHLMFHCLVEECSNKKIQSFGPQRPNESMKSNELDAYFLSWKQLERHFQATHLEESSWRNKFSLPKDLRLAYCKECDLEILCRSFFHLKVHADQEHKNHGKHILLGCRICQDFRTRSDESWKKHFNKDFSDCVGTFKLLEEFRSIPTTHQLKRKTISARANLVFIDFNYVDYSAINKSKSLVSLGLELSSLGAYRCQVGEGSTSKETKFMEYISPSWIGENNGFAFTNASKNSFLEYQQLKPSKCGDKLYSFVGKKDCCSEEQALKAFCDYLAMVASSHSSSDIVLANFNSFSAGRKNAFLSVLLPKLRLYNLEEKFYRHIVGYVDLFTPEARRGFDAMFGGDKRSSLGDQSFLFRRRKDQASKTIDGFKKVMKHSWPSDMFKKPSKANQALAGVMCLLQMRENGTLNKIITVPSTDMSIKTKHFSTILLGKLGFDPRLKTDISCTIRKSNFPADGPKVIGLKITSTKQHTSSMPISSRSVSLGNTKKGTKLTVNVPIKKKHAEFENTEKVFEKWIDKIVRAEKEQNTSAKQGIVICPQLDDMSDNEHGKECEKSSSDLINLDFSSELNDNVLETSKNSAIIDDSSHIQMCVSKDSSVVNISSYIKTLIESLFNDCIEIVKNNEKRTIGRRSKKFKCDFAKPINPLKKRVVLNENSASFIGPLPMTTSQSDDNDIFSSVVNKIVNDCIEKSEYDRYLRLMKLKDKYFVEQIVNYVVDCCLIEACSRCSTSSWNSSDVSIEQFQNIFCNYECIDLTYPYGNSVPWTQPTEITNIYTNESTGIQCNDTMAYPYDTRSCEVTSVQSKRFVLGTDISVSSSSEITPDTSQYVMSDNFQHDSLSDTLGLPIIVQERNSGPYYSIIDYPEYVSYPQEIPDEEIFGGVLTQELPEKSKDSDEDEITYDDLSTSLSNLAKDGAITQLSGHVIERNNQITKYTSNLTYHLKKLSHHHDQMMDILKEEMNDIRPPGEDEYHESSYQHLNNEVMKQNQVHYIDKSGDVASPNNEVFFADKLPRTFTTNHDKSQEQNNSCFGVRDALLCQNPIKLPRIG